MALLSAQAIRLDRIALQLVLANRNITQSPTEAVIFKGLVELIRVS
jgi:hypothetical protein